METMQDINNKIHARYITKQYAMLKRKSDKLLHLFGLKKTTSSFWPLRGVSFDIKSGETIGIVGVNGSGKSTLLNIISGVTQQTTGKLEINGTVSLLSIGTGLKPALSGRENIRLKSMMMGMTKQAIDEREADIVRFADIGEFIDQPVKSYSSGMRSRLGFAIAVHQDPDILIIDEALSVGDGTFFDKSLKKINEFKAQGKTILFVSHSLRQVQDISDRVMWLHYGEIRYFGEPEFVIKKFNGFLHRFREFDEAQKYEYQATRKGLQKNFKPENIELMPADINGFKLRTEVENFRQSVEEPMKNYQMPWYLKGGLIALLMLASVMIYLAIAPNVGGSKLSQATPKVVKVNKKNKVKAKATRKKPIKRKSSATTKPTIYVVQPGDYLAGIAERYGSSYQEIMQLNGLQNGQITVGQELKIPQSATQSTDGE